MITETIKKKTQITLKIPPPEPVSNLITQSVKND